MSNEMDRAVEAAAEALYNTQPEFRTNWRGDREAIPFEDLPEGSRRYRIRGMGIAIKAAFPWRPIETAPEDQRVLLCNELWAGTFGEVQIGYRQQGKWLFDGEMNINDMDDLVGDDSGVSAVDYLPLRWKPLPDAAVIAEQETK